MVQVGDHRVVDIIDRVLSRLDAPRHSMPDAAGLYAIHGSDGVWEMLNAGEPVAHLPLYVGKAGDSLITRDLRTHFGNGRTGSATVRRIFAALLRVDLGVSGMQRNPSKPGHFSNYGLSPSDDQRLTDWIRAHLEIAVWVTDRSRQLRRLERCALRRLNPLLTIEGVVYRWKALVRSGRAVMAAEAGAWSTASHPNSSSSVC